MDIRFPGRAWPQPPQGEGNPSRPGGAARHAQAPAEPFVLDLEPIEEGIPLRRPPAQNPSREGGSLPHRGRLIDIQI